ncbi:MAG: NAD(P)-binding protein [Ignavibacteriaceae bacterium]|nr:NAD(P)-binding protein [Ignavibacteriaceae bacterium]
MDSNKFDVIIIGSGITGLSAGTSLLNSGKSVLILDKGKAAGGRTASRRIESPSKNSFDTVDYGAPGFEVFTPVFKNFVSDFLSKGILKSWFDILAFDNNAVISKYCGVNSMREFAIELSKNLNITQNFKVVKISLDNATNLWEVTGETGISYFCSNLFLTAPLPQSLELLQISSIKLPYSSLSILDLIQYEKCIVLAIQPVKEFIFPEQGFIDNFNHNIFLAVDNHKKGIKCSNQLITLYFSAALSEEIWDYNSDSLVKALFNQSQEILKGESPVSYFAHKWRYSKPTSFYHEPFFTTHELPGLYICGDAFVKEGVEGAFLSGKATANHILNEDKPD